MLSVRFFVAFIASSLCLPICSFAEPAHCPDSGLCMDRCCGSCTADVLRAQCNRSCLWLADATCTAAMYCKFNTNASEYNYLEISNRADDVLRGTITYRTAAGSEITSTPLVLSPHQRMDVDVHSVVGPNSYGQIVVKVGQTESLTEIGASVSHYISVDGALRQTATEQCVTSAPLQ